MPKYLIVIRTESLNPPVDAVKRMVHECFLEDKDVRISKVEQVKADTTSLPIFEVLVDSDAPPFGKLPAHILRLVRA